MLSDARPLEGGVLVYLDSKRAIHLPTLTLHSTLTNTGGFLAGIQWCAAQSVVAVAKVVIFELRFSQRERFTREETCERLEIELSGLYDCLEGALLVSQFFMIKVCELCNKLRWDFATSVEEIMRHLHAYVMANQVLYLGISDTPAWVVVKANESVVYRFLRYPQEDVNNQV
jgi:hypothetical protein